MREGRSERRPPGLRLCAGAVRWRRCSTSRCSPLGVATITLVILLSRELEQRLVREAAGIDLVVGAKGSPLQLVLAGVYHADVPPGNVPLAAVEELARRPLVRQVIPMALGDSYRGFRIVGTEPAFVAHYGATLAQGRAWSAPMEAVLGSEVARATGLGGWRRLRRFARTGRGWRRPRRDAVPGRRRARADRPRDRSARADRDRQRVAGACARRRRRGPRPERARRRATPREPATEPAPAREVTLALVKYASPRGRGEPAARDQCGDGAAGGIARLRVGAPVHRVRHRHRRRPRLRAAPDRRFRRSACSWR